MAEVVVKLGAADVVQEKKIQVDDADARPWGVDAKLAVVGTDVPRVDGTAKASGTARYAYDVARKDLAFAKALRCPHAHANVKSVNLDKAKAMPGVLAAERIG